MALTVKAASQQAVAIDALKAMAKRQSLDSPPVGAENDDPSILAAAITVLDRSSEVFKKSTNGGGQLLNAVSKRQQAKKNREGPTLSTEQKLMGLVKEPVAGTRAHAAPTSPRRGKKKRPRRASNSRRTDLPSPPKSPKHDPYKMPSGNLFKKGRTYTAVEAILLLTELKDKGSKCIGKVIAKLIENKCIDCGRSRVFARLKAFEESKRDVSKVRTWRDNGGAPAIITDEDLRGIMKKRKAESGGAIDRTLFDNDVDDVFNSNLIRDGKKSRAEKKRKLSATHKATLFNYMLTLKTDDGRSYVPLKSTFKTEVRVAAEESRMSAVAFAATVAATTRIDLVAVPPGYKPSEIDKYFDKPGIMMDDWQQVNTDSTKICITPNKQKTKVETFALSGQETSTQSIWSTNPNVSSFLSGSMMVELFACMSGDGATAPVSVVVAVSEEVLPKETFPSGILRVSIPGLAPGASVDPRNKLDGYLYLKRAGTTPEGEESVHVRLAEKMTEDVVYPFIAANREKHLGLKAEDAVPAHAAVVISNDGHDEVVKATSSEAVLTAEENKQIRRYKHSASRTGAEQAADLSPVFKYVKL